MTTVTARAARVKLPKVYLGSSMANMARVRDLNEQLRELGLDVVSTWAAEPPDRIARVAAIADARELLSADMVVIDTTVPSSTGGWHSEIGLALASGKTLAIVGPCTNIFAELATQKFYDWEECFAWLRLVVQVEKVLG